MKTRASISIGPQVGVPSPSNQPFVIPFGKFRSLNESQKFTKAEAEEIKKRFFELRGSASGLAGIPVYAGFPSVPGRPESHPSKPALGWVESLEITDRGLLLSVKWGAGSASMEAKEFRFIAPVWLVRPDLGNQVPTKIVALGLTNQPAEVHGNFMAENDVRGSKSRPAAARSAAVAAEMEKLRGGCLSETDRYGEAWNRAAKKAPQLFN